MYIDINEIECTVMDNKNVLKEKFMRKMKRFMAFALSAAMMLTTVNMPAVTAWAQDDSKAGMAELAADEAKTPVSADMTATKTIFPYGEKLCLDRFVKVDVTYENGTTEKLTYGFDSNGGCYSAADDYGNDYKFMFGAAVDNMADIPDNVSAYYKGEQTLYFCKRNQETYNWDVLASTGIEFVSPVQAAESLKVGENKAYNGGVYKFDMAHAGRLVVSYEDAKGEVEELKYMKDSDGDLSYNYYSNNSDNICSGGNTYYYRASDIWRADGDDMTLNVTYEKLDELQIGENVFPLEKSGKKYFTITPEKDARYIFESLKDQSLTVDLYDNNGKSVSCSSYGYRGDSKVTGIEADLKANVEYTVYIGGNPWEDLDEAKLEVNTVESAYSGYTELKLDQPVKIDTPAADTDYIFGFTPDVDGEYVFIGKSAYIETYKLGDRDMSIGDRGTYVDREIVSLNTATLEKGERYIAVVESYSDDGSIKPITVEVARKRTLSSINIKMSKDTFAPNDFRGILSDVTVTAVYDDGYEEVLPAPGIAKDQSRNTVHDKYGNEYNLKLDDEDFWMDNYGSDLDQGDQEHSLKVQNVSGDISGEAKIKFGRLSDFEFPKVSVGENDIEAYTYYSFTVSQASKLSSEVEGLSEDRNPLMLYDEDGKYITFGSTIFLPGHTYYMNSETRYDQDDNYYSSYIVNLKENVMPDLAGGECTAEVQNGYAEWIFRTTMAGTYIFSLPDMDDDMASQCSIGVFDLDGEYIKGESVYLEVELEADTYYKIGASAPSGVDTLRATAKRLSIPESAVITMAKTDYVVGMDAGYFNGMRIDFTNDDGTTTVAENFKSSVLYGTVMVDAVIYYSMNGGEKKPLSAITPMTETGVMTIYVMLDDKVLGSYDVNIKSYDQVDIPELVEGDNPDTVLFRFYKFTATADQPAVFEANDKNAYFDVYKLEEGNFVKLDAETKLNAGETYYCKAWRYEGNSNDQTDVNLSFRTIRKLTAIKLTGFDRPLYNLGAGAMKDSMQMMMRSVHYTLIYNDGSEEKRVLGDGRQPAVGGYIGKNGDKGFIANVSCGSFSDTIEIPFADPATAPLLTLKDNKAHIDLADAGQYVYKFKAPVTGYYNLEVSMPDGYYECYSNFYKSTELDSQPNVDMNQRLVKAGETYYVCIYAYSKTLDINLVCKPQIKAATTTADGVKIVSKKVGTGAAAYYELAEEKIARIKTVTLASTSYTYDTKVKKPAVTVKDSAGKVIAASNYTVAYSNNTNVGTATVKITFKGDYSGTVTRTFAIKKFAAPAAPKVTKLENTAKGIVVTWTVSANATSYEIYRSVKGGKFVKADTLYIKGTSRQRTLGYVDLKAKTNGIKYAYKIVAVGTLGNVTVKSATSAGMTAYYMVAPSGIKMSNSVRRTVRVSYAANSKASGYQIRYSLKSSMAGAKVIKMAGSRSVAKNITGLTKGGKYYVSVRSYKTVGKTAYYSAWSTPKSVTVSK